MRSEVTDLPAVSSCLLCVCVEGGMLLEDPRKREGLQNFKRMLEGILEGN